MGLSLFTRRGRRPAQRVLFKDASAPAKKSRGNPEGKAFEKFVEVVAARAFYSVPLPRIGAIRLGAELIPQAMPYDKVLIHRTTQRPIIFDCKSVDAPTRFNVGSEDLVKRNQCKHLTRAGSEGVIAGLLIEARAIGAIYWLPWPILVSPPPSIPWTDKRLVRVGDAGKTLDLVKLLPAQQKENLHVET